MGDMRITTGREHCRPPFNADPKRVNDPRINGMQGRVHPIIHHVTSTAIETGCIIHTAIRDDATPLAPVTAFIVLSRRPTTSAKHAQNGAPKPPLPCRVARTVLRLLLPTSTAYV
jgi:hypothetical protein